MISKFKDSFGRILKNQLLAGSVVLFAGSIVTSFGNYLFHLFMGRLLGPVDYGVLSSLISLTYWFGVPVGTLGLVVVKYVSVLRGQKRVGQIDYFYSWLNKKLLVIGALGFILLISLSGAIVSFLHFESTLPVLLIMVSSLIGVYATVNGAILQGFLRFGLMSALGIVNVVLKLGIAILLVYLGHGVLGGVSAISVASLTGYLLTALFAVRLLKGAKSKEKAVDGREIIKYAIPVFFSTLAFVSLYTTDIVLARHFLSAREAGFYAALATLGKIVFFASSPIITVMFPMISERHASGKQYLNFLNLSFGLVILGCLGVTSVYFFFPELMIKVLFGSQYLPASPHLFLFAIFISLYTFSSLLVNFYLSIKKIKVVVLPMMAALLQAVGIFVFHQNLSQIVLVSVGALGLLFISLLLYLFKEQIQTRPA